MPTHLDSHRHAHLRGEGPAVFAELAAALGVPLRYDGQVHILSSFYAQWEWKVTDLGHVSVPFLQQLLREEVSAGWTELLCHPGWVSPDFASVYLMEREEELRTLRDPLIRATIAELNITLASYADFRPQGEAAPWRPKEFEAHGDQRLSALFHKGASMRPAGPSAAPAVRGSGRGRFPGDEGPGFPLAGHAGAGDLLAPDARGRALLLPGRERPG
jgi:hypothetical protein